MILATENIRLPGLNLGDIVDFSDVKTLEQLKQKIVENYVVLCRKCASESSCKFYDRTEPPCPVLSKVVSNFIDMNIKSINTENQNHLKDFIKSTVLLINIFNRFENWKGIYVDNDFNWYFESAHPFLNLSYGHNLLIELSKFLKAYRTVKINRLKKFTIFVEGKSEYEALPIIFDSLGLLGVSTGIKNKVQFINLDGKDRIQKDKIKLVLNKLREEEVSYFIVLDNDNNTKQYIDDLIREGLIEKSHCLIWDNKFEDNFDEVIILQALKEEAREAADKIELDELIKGNDRRNDIAKTVDDLLRGKGVAFSFANYKVRIAKRIAERIRSEKTKANATELPKLTAFIEKLKEVIKEMETLSTNFHVITDESDVANSK
jgi:hypothetical protein